jgi:hypothetical protein
VTAPFAFLSARMRVPTMFDFFRRHIYPIPLLRDFRPRRRF